jgi:hypothetical protein
MEEISSDLIQFLDMLRRCNQNYQMILTTASIPLVATARTDAHVLAATFHAKSVLRAAAEAMTRARPGVACFPSG